MLTSQFFMVQNKVPIRNFQIKSKLNKKPESKVGEREAVSAEADVEVGS